MDKERETDTKTKRKVCTHRHIHALIAILFLQPDDPQLPSLIPRQRWLGFRLSHLLPAGGIKNWEC